MGISLGGAKAGAVAEINVVPLIDILLVLLIIFMVISPHVPTGLSVVLPQQVKGPAPVAADDAIVVEVLGNGSLRINQTPVRWQDFQARLADVFKTRANRVAFVRGDGILEFGVIARAIDVMRSAGIDSVGLMTAELENAR